MTAGAPRQFPITAADIRSLDGKIRPTISGPLAHYIRDLLKTGLYGDRETEVVPLTDPRRHSKSSNSGNLIPLRRFDDKTMTDAAK